MRFHTFTAAIALAPLVCGAACGAARADDAPTSDNLAPSTPEARATLWKNAPLAVGAEKEATQSQFSDEATQQISLVAALRGWRDTLDGRGKLASRELARGEVLGRGLKLNLGRVAPPNLAGAGGTAGVSAQWGAVEVGSTLRPRELDEALAEFDRALSGLKPKKAEPQNVTWLRAQPLAGKDGTLELNVARAGRDTASGEAVKMREGTFVGASGGLKLPLRWQINGDWSQASLDEAEQNKATWNAKLKGPVAHPLGQASAEIEWRETEAGYATLAQSDANGGTQGAARVTQDIKTNRLSGQLRLAATERERRNLAAAKSGDELENRGASGAADLNLKVTPNLSLRAVGTVGAAQVTRAGDEFAAALQAESIAQDATFLEETQTQGGDIGVEWKLSQALSVAATLGASQTQNWRDAPDARDNWTSFGESAENRVGFEMRHKTGAGTLLAKYSARARDDESLADWQRLQTLRLQAERPLFFGLKLGATVDIARGGDASWGDDKGMARRVEAQLSFSRAARLDLKFRDGAALPGQWLSDPLSAPFRPAGGTLWNAGDREYGARFNTGSAANGKGLGLAFEYARQQHSGTGTDQWRVGVTWK